MSVIDLTADLGLEMIQREAFIVLVQNINTAIAEQEAIWDERDEELATILDAPKVETNLEMVEKQNFYQGHHPSLIEAELDRFPNVCVISDRADPGPGNLDQVTVYRDRLVVEVMVKSEINEGEVNRRVHRTTSAVNAVLQANRTLNGRVQEIAETPRAFITDVVGRKAQTSYGAQWYWQGSRLEYVVQKEAVMPPSSTGAFMAGASIDQS